MTLRAKLLLTVLGLVAIALIVSDVTSTTTLRSYMLKQTDQQLGAARAPVARRLMSSSTTAVTTSAGSSLPATTTTVASTGRTTTSASPPPDGGVPRAQLISDFFIQVRSPSGVIESQFTPTVLENKDPIPDLPQALVQAHSEKKPFTVGAVDDSSLRYRVIVSKAPSGDTLIAAVTMRNLDNTIARLRNIELTVSVLILAALGFAAWAIVRTELRQLDRIAATAGAIAAGDLSKRVDQYNAKTEVGRLSEALNSMLTQIEASFTEKQVSEDRLRRFAADASHELRTPLTAIRGYAELFRQGAIRDEEHLARVLQRIESEAARMGLMVEDLLLLARLDQGRPMAFDEVDVTQVVSDVIHDSQVVAGDRTLALVTNCQATVIGDTARLHQVFSNLIGNALAHTPPDASVNVSIEAESDIVVVNVKDNGPGLEPDAAKRVFERFFRVDSGRSRHTGGTGLGLAIVKSIVDAHDGEVSVASPPGGGACFTVKLPRVQAFTATTQS